MKSPLLNPPHWRLSNNTRTQWEAPSLGDLNVSNKSKHTEYTHMKSPCLTLPYEIGGQILVKSSTMEGSVIVILPTERQPCPSRWRPAAWLHETLRPTVWPMPLANAKNGDKQLHQVNEKAQHALMRSPVFFFWEGWGRCGKGIFCFFSCSQCVPIMFPWGSQRFLEFSSSQVVPQDVPNSTWVSSPIICPKFNSHAYKLKRLAIGENICLYFVTWGPKRCFYWRVPNVPEIFW
jgi:hypothetical protein